MTTPVADDTTTFLATDAVVAFAARVRAELDDLAPDDRDELTDGLEAELLDRVLDDGPDSLGDPVAYASELRSAAGLPARSSRRPSARDSIGQFRGGVRDAARAFVARHPRIGAMRDFFAALRPFWWVLRAVIAYQTAVFLLSGMGGGSGWWLLPIDFGKLLVVTAFVVVSVQFGRGKWSVLAGPQWLRRGVAVVLIVATPFVVANAISTVNQNYWGQYSASDPNSYDLYPNFGKAANGAPIFNVFAYDETGQPVPNVRLFDQDGNPLTVVGGDGWTYSEDPMSGSRFLVPGESTLGSDGWNVYPLSTIGASGLDDWGIVKDTALRVTPTFPFVELAPLSSAAVGAESPAAPGADAGTGDSPESAVG